MHVVIPVSDDPWHPRPGGIVAYSLGLATYLSNEGVDVEFLSVGGGDASSAIRTTPVAARIRGEIGYARALSAYSRRRSWDSDTIVVANTELYAWSMRRAQSRLRFVLVSHGPTLPTLSSRRPLAAAAFRVLVEPRTVRLLEAVIAIDREAEDYFARRYPTADVRRIALGVDTDHFRLVNRAESRMKWSLDDELGLLVAGRIAPIKNPALAAAAFERVVERKPDAVLMVAGVGPASRPYRRIQERLGNRRVRLLGLVARTQLPSLYSAADGLLLTSKQEQFPTVVVESLGCGTPVFATDVGDVPLILDRREAGEICRPTPDAFAEKVLARLPESTVVRDSDLAIRRETAERYSWKQIGPKVLSVLRGDRPRKD